MSATSAPDAELSDFEPFSLYLQLEKGRFADLEVVSRAALAFAAAVRDAAYVVDPSLGIRVEMQSGTTGSLRFNTLIRGTRLKDLLSRAHLKSLSYVCLVWFGAKSSEYTYEKVMDHIFPSDSTAEISQKDKEEIARLTADIIMKGIARDHVQSVYKNLHEDPAIVGVGGSREQRGKPKFIVPRAEFAARSGAHSEHEMHIKIRTRNSTEVVTLISPVLLDESPRRWKVRGAEGEFGASMKDEPFLKSLSHGQISVPMTADIHLLVRLQTKEHFHDGIWEVRERNILKVLDIKPPLTQANFDLTPHEPRSNPEEQRQ